MKRPAQRRARPPLSTAEREALAARARYVGSLEHKDAQWWNGLPRARQLPHGRIGRRGRQTTTVCPLTTERDRARATEWLRRAIVAGQYRFVESDQDFPRKVWYIEASGRIWCGYCINSTAGAYKGWPIDEDERRAIFDRVDRRGAERFGGGTGDALSSPPVRR